MGHSLALFQTALAVLRLRTRHCSASNGEAPEQGNEDCNQLAHGVTVAISRLTRTAASLMTSGGGVVGATPSPRGLEGCRKRSTLHALADPLSNPRPPLLSTGALFAKQAQAIAHHQEACAHVGKHGHPHRGVAKHS